jgi:hypothetical protein
MTNETDKAKLKETDKPWERPGQVAQNPDEKPPSKEDLETSFEQASKTS